MTRSLQKAFEKIDFTAIKRAFDEFNQTMLEGHYGADKKSIWSFFFKPKNVESDAMPVIAGNRLFQMSSKTLGSKYVWPPLIAVLSVQLQLATVVVLGAAGAGLLGYEYMRCRRMRHEIITEVNVAGQTVTGTRADLYRLHRAQASILNLSSSFRPASTESTRDTIQDIMRTVAAERARVTILDGGNYGAAVDKYYFSRQLLGLVTVHDTHSQPVVGAAPAPLASDRSALRQLASGDLTRAFRTPAAPLSNDDVVAHLLALEKALPDDVRSRFRANLAADPLPTAPIAKPAAVLAMAA